jgi:hypothetical protein
VGGAEGKAEENMPAPLAARGDGKLARRHLRRHRMLFLAGLALLLAIGAGSAWMVRQALKIRAADGSEFTQWAEAHGIGRVALADDASGFHPDFCVLLVPQPIPEARLASEVVSLLKTYHDLDGGRILSVRYRDPATHQEITEADAAYDPKTQTVGLVLHLRGGTKSEQIHVDWTASP